VRVWVASKVTRGIVVVVLVLIFHGGYCVDYLHHFHHHHHPHPHQLLRLPTIERSPNYEGFELPKVNEDSRDGVFDHLLKGF